MSKTDCIEKAKSLPGDPGCYLMKNSRSQIIYVGKAKDLKKRVSSYFQSSKNHSPKTKKLVKEIDQFDIIMTETEVEALLLERTLIRDHQPRFNILLRDDKEYPWVRIDYNEKWPRIEKVRKRKKDGASYLGPFGSERQLNSMLTLVGKVFPVIRCSRHELENAKRPCNYYEMKMCLAPCVLDIKRQDYLDMIKNGLKVLEGKNTALAKDLNAAMIKASSEQNYEKAALFRDQLQTLTEFENKQSVVIKDIVDADVIGIASLHQKISFHVLFVRDGKLSGGDGFSVKSEGHSNDEALSEFLLQYYDSHSLPEIIFLPEEITDMGLIERALSEKANQKLSIVVPQKGQKRDLVQMAYKNASYLLEEDLRTVGKKKIELELIKTNLRLENTPHRVECIDISNTGDTAIVASNVCFIDGKPAKDQYRIYNITSTDGKQDDFASILEVVERRLKRAEEKDDTPDLLIIDGGKGQLSKAVEAKNQYPGLEFDLVSLAKSREKNEFHEGPTTSSERIFYPGDPIPHVLEIGSPEFRLFTSIRDEAHRFAITHHRKKRDQISMSSPLAEISGVGKTLENRLLEHFKGLQGVKKARLDELEAIKGVSKELAHKIFTHLKHD